MIVWKVTYENSIGSIEKFARSIWGAYNGVLSTNLKPHHVEVDTVYLGRALYERLRELGVPVVAINPLSQARFATSMNVLGRVIGYSSLMPPEWINSAMERWRIRLQPKTPLGQWFQERVEFKPELKRKKGTSLTDLYRDFSLWCVGKGIFALPSAIFVQVLRDRGYDSYQHRGQLMFKVRIRVSP